jgi:hypothetical protein
VVSVNEYVPEARLVEMATSPEYIVLPVPVAVSSESNDQAR